jgi:hypothetical protein
MNPTDLLSYLKSIFNLETVAPGIIICQLAYNNHINALKTFITNYEKMPNTCGLHKPPLYDIKKICVIAAKYGHVEILDWLYINEHATITEEKTLNHKFILHDDICGIAGKNNQLNVLKWALNNHLAYNDKVYEFAVLNKQQTIIDWIDSNDKIIQINKLKQAINEIERSYSDDIDYITNFSHESGTQKYIDCENHFMELSSKKKKIKKHIIELQKN